jgi:hypothetical protein
LRRAVSPDAARPALGPDLSRGLRRLRALGAVGGVEGEGIESFSTPGVAGRCEGDLGAGAFSGSCEGARFRRFGANENGSLSARRTAPATSIFGELGGTWTAETAAGAKCSAVFEGNVVTVACDGGERNFDGSMTLTFSNDLVSGSTSRGVEIAAIRKR